MADHNRRNESPGARASSSTGDGASLPDPNVARLRTEDEPRLLLEIYWALQETSDFRVALRSVLQKICEFAHWDRGEAWIPNEDNTLLVQAASWYRENAATTRLEALRKDIAFTPGLGLNGRVWLSKSPEWVQDVSATAGTIHRPALLVAGVKATFAVPIVSGAEVLAVLTFLLFEKRATDPTLIDIVSAVAAQLGVVMAHKRTEEELAQSEALFRAVVDASTRVIYVKDRNFLYLTVNREFERLFSCTKEAVRGKTDFDLFPHEIAERFRANDLAVIEAGIPLEFEEVVEQSDGLHTYLSNKYPMIDALGKMYAICGISADITEQKRQEALLRRAESSLSEAVRQQTADLVRINQELLLLNRHKEALVTELQREKDLSQKLIDTAPIAILLLDTASRVMYANPYFEDATGFSLRELQAQDALELIPELERERQGEIFRAAIDGYSASGVIARVLTRSRGEREFEWYTVPLRDSDGKVTGMLSTGLDITERRRAELWFKTLIETAQDALVSIDRQARIVMFNPAAERIFGYRAHEIIGEKVNLLMAEPYARDHDGYIARYESTGEARALGRIRTVAAKRKNGEQFPIELSVTEVAMDDDVHYAAFIRDISEKVRLEGELVEKEKLAAVGLTAAKIGHELANPLNSVSLALQVLEQRVRRIGGAEETAQTVKQVVKIREEVSRLNNLLLDFRAFARKENFRFRPTDLRELIADLIELEGPRLGNENIRMVADLPADLPPIMADADKLKQILLNLCKNSAEALPQGGEICIGARVVDQDVLLEVADNGTGIPPGTDIFEPFFTTKREGTGLGLTIVRQMVAGHGGTISYTSAPGQGTTFRVTIPRSGGSGAT